ncbi:MAG: thioredoxin family protein [Flammeovirgaceae bacterium]|jgi:peroxiredoxin|nr:thioredoxin family protein [Flammeovirgaceae bacterium]MCZ8071122.1 thioredoxin family protein [Cytophagales bacterium]
MKRVVILLVLVAFTWAGAPVKNGYDIGDTAADFKLKNVDGKVVSLADFKEAKGYIVIFDCNTCPYSKAYNDRIIALNDKFAAKGFPVIAINPNDPSKSGGDSFDEMAKLAKRKNYTFPYLVDETQSVATAFGATNTPHVFVLDKALKVQYIGAIDDNARNEKSVSKRYVEDAVNALLSGKPVPVTKVKAIGCGIKWKNA